MNPAVVLLVAMFAIGVDNYIVAAILPQLAVGLGQTTPAVGLLASAYALPNAILAPAFGPLSDRVGRRIAMVLGMAVFVIAVAASALAPNFEALLTARFVNGLGAAIMLPAIFAYAADIASPEQRGRAMATVLSAFPVSTILGLPLGGLITAFAGWRAVFVFIGLVAVGALVLLWRLPSDRPKPGTAIAYLEGFRLAARSRPLLTAVAVTFVWFSAAFGLFIYAGSFFTRSFGFGPFQVGLVFTIIGFVGFAATRVGARFIDAVGPKRAIMLGIGAFAVAAFLLPNTAAFLPWALANLALWIFGTWFGLPAMQTLISGLVPTARGTALAANSSALYAGAVVGPIVSGAVLAAGGFDLAGPWSAVLALVALVLAAWLLPNELPSEVADEMPGEMLDGVAR